MSKATRLAHALSSIGVIRSSAPPTAMDAAIDPAIREFITHRSNGVLGSSLPRPTLRMPARRATIYDRLDSRFGPSPTPLLALPFGDIVIEGVFTSFWKELT